MNCIKCSLVFNIFYVIIIFFFVQAVQPLLEQLGAEISEAEDSPEEGDKTATVERKVSYVRFKHFISLDIFEHLNSFS